MGLDTFKLEVESVVGSETGVPGEKITYTANRYNLDEFEERLKRQIKWAVKVDGVIKPAGGALSGETVEIILEKKWEGKEILVMAQNFFRDFKESAGQKTKVEKFPRTLVKEISECKEASCGQTVKYKVIRYNRQESSVSSNDKKNIKWAVEVDGIQEELTDKKGESINLTIKEEWDGKEITVMACLNGFDKNVSTRTRVQPTSTLVREISEHKEAFGGQTVEYSIVQYNKERNNVSETDKNNVRWAVKIDGKQEELKDKKGEKISLEIKKEWEGKEILVMACLNKFNETVSQKTMINKRMLLYLEFFDSKETMFAESAQSRMQNIYESIGYDSTIHKVHCVPIQDISELHTIIPKYIEKYGGAKKAFCKEVAIFSHCALDGPKGHEATSLYPIMVTKTNFLGQKQVVPGKQMTMEGWGAIEFNWAENSKFALFGCRSGSERIDEKSFAKNISKCQNFKDVEIWGQPRYSYPSFYPTHRVSTGARHTGLFIEGSHIKTYMVAREKDELWGATYFGEKNNAWELTNKELEKYPKAYPMNCYKNGIRVRVACQSYFNTHLKKNNL